MAASRGFEAELAAVHDAGALPPEQALPVLRKALLSRNNFVVSAAAKYAARLELHSLADGLAESFNRFLPAAGNPAKIDPQCWAKLEIVRALASFEYEEPAPFLAGLRCIQLEPTWGGSSDTAGPLRETCALALVQCRSLPVEQLCRHLLPLFRDKELPVRVAATRALEQLGNESCALLLRLRAELGSDQPEVLGACFSAVLRLEGESSFPWAAGFLSTADETANEAVFALAEQRSEAALACLTRAFASSYKGELRPILMSAIASMRTPAAITWLLAAVEQGGLDARLAAEALWSTEPSEDTAAQLTRLGFNQP